MKTNKHKKLFSFVVIFSILSLAIFSLIFGLMASKSKIIFHTPENNNITLNKNDIKEIENNFDTFSSNLEKNLRDDTGDGGDEGGETDSSIVFSNQTVKEMTADWIVIGFMNYALTGDTHYPNPDSEDTNPEANVSITDPNEDSNWIVPHLFNSSTSEQQLSYEDFYKYSSYTKLIYETIGNNKKTEHLNTYINEFTTKYDEISDMVYEENLSDVDNVWVNIEDNDDSTISIFDSETLNLISKTIEYEKDITNFMYIYSYLWQEDNSDKYDYILTRLMNQKRFTYYWQLEVKDKNGFNSIDEFNEADGIEVDEWNNTGTNYYNKTDIDSESKISPNGYMGFQGLSSQQDSSISLTSDGEDYSEEFWDYSNVWNVEQNLDDEFEGKPSYISSYNQGDFQNNMFEPSEGNFIFESTGETDPDDPEAEVVPKNYIYINVLLYPFTFSDNLDLGGTSDHWFYRLGAYQSEDGNIYPEETKPDNSEYINWFDYISSQFNSTFPEYGMFEIFTIYEMLNYSLTDFNTIQNRAYNYWNARGFYIELIGNFKDDYENLIPSGLQER